MVPHPRAGSFSPNPVQTPQTGPSHLPHPAQPGPLNPGASPSTNSPTATINPITGIVVAQVYLLLSTIREDKDRSKWEFKAEQLRKLIDNNGMEVFSKYFTRLVAGNASAIFPGLGRPVGSSSNYHILLGEMQKLGTDVEQSSKIAESIESGTEDIFRDFDLATFVDHFELDPLERAALALAFKIGNRPDLKPKADAILSANFPAFVDLLSRPASNHEKEPSPAFLAFVLDRFVQYHPPTFNAAAKAELADKVRQRYPDDQPPPADVLAALDLVRVLGDKPPNALALYIHRTGPDFTRDRDTCLLYLNNRPKAIHLSEEQVSAALTYTTVSQSPRHDPAVLTSALVSVVPATFSWQNVVSYFDHRTSRISSAQFLRLYRALLPIAARGGDDADNVKDGGDESAAAAAARLDIQSLWGGQWENAETQLSYICAYGSLTPDQLDATTIPGLVSGLSLEFYAQSDHAVRQRAAEAVRHTLSSVAALSAIFHLALHSNHASTTIEAKRLFQDVVVPNLDVFMVTAFEVPKPWGQIAHETLNSLFENFLHKQSPHHDFVLDTLWRKHRTWILTRFTDLYESRQLETGKLVELTAELGWLEELIHLPTSLGCELAVMAHTKGILDLSEWARRSMEERGHDVAEVMGQFLLARAADEMEHQRPAPPPDGPGPGSGSGSGPGSGQGAAGSVPVKSPTPTPTPQLRVRTISTLLQILEDILPRAPVPQLITIQRLCITAYPRLINYGEGYDEIIDANGHESNALPPAANVKMEEHYKRMYNHELQVRDVVGILNRYKHSRDPLDQDIFACMIHSLFDEYRHYTDYPLEALATNAVLFGGVISHKLISDLPLKIGLGMILEAVRDHQLDHPMHKFGLQALMQLSVRLREWPGFCAQLTQIPSLHGTEAWTTAQDVVCQHGEEAAAAAAAATEAEEEPTMPPPPPQSVVGGEAVAAEEPAVPSVPPLLGSDRPSLVSAVPLITAVNVDPRPTGARAGSELDEPNDETQGRVQFVLNNLTDSTLPAMCGDLRDMLGPSHKPWFASHLVEERAKMQPNYHAVYLELVRLFEDRTLWTEVLQETYAAVRRMLNSEVTMQSAVERSHLKNLGAWLGLLTLARDKPIRHKNIAFRKLLFEALDTRRLPVVIPFVCKVLMQGATSSVFRPPNPWLMDMIHLLIELYHHAELKLNLKFEIEVLCKGLNLDHKSIEPTGELLARIAADAEADEATAATAAAASSAAAAAAALDLRDGIGRIGGVAGGGVIGGIGLDSFVEAMNGLNGGGGALSMPVPAIPDLGPHVSVPPINEMVISPARLGEIVRGGVEQAIRDIIGPVVERSVTIAAIATLHIIRKDFSTEGDEARVRSCAISMVKTTAGSLALVTSKEPMRTNLTNYIRNSSAELPQGLPEGTIIMCVNSNLELACSIVERSAEDRAVPEIEELLEPDLEARRRHRLTRPNEPFVDPNLNRWALAMPSPYKLSPGLGGLNPEQMGIYEDFARQSRPLLAGPSLSVSSAVAAAAAASAATAPSSATPTVVDVARSLAGSAGGEMLLQDHHHHQQQQQHHQHHQHHSHQQQSLQQPLQHHLQQQQLHQPHPHHSHHPQNHHHHHYAIPTPSETPSIPPHLGSGQIPPPYGGPLLPSGLAANGGASGNGRGAAFPVDLRGMFDRFQKLVMELRRVAAESREEHFLGLPRPHPVLDVVDAVVQCIIKASSQSSEDFAVLAAEQICGAIFAGQIDDNLALESLVHVLETLRRINLRGLSQRVAMMFRQQPAIHFLNLPLLAALVRTDLVDWRNVDTALSGAVRQRKDGSLEFFEHLLELTLLTSRPVLLYSDFAQTLEAAWTWIREDGGASMACQRLRAKLTTGVGARGSIGADAGVGGPLGQHLQQQQQHRQELMEYVFDEWVHMYLNSTTTDKIALAFVRQMQATSVIGSRDDLLFFLRIAIDMTVDAFELSVQQSHHHHPGQVPPPPAPSLSELYAPTDAVAYLIKILLVAAAAEVDDEDKEEADDAGRRSSAAVGLLDSIVALIGLVLRHHHVRRAAGFSQRVFYRLLSGTLSEVSNLADGLTRPRDRQRLITRHARRLADLGPRHLPGFACGWLLLIQHRCFLPLLVRDAGRAGRAVYTSLLVQQLEFLGGMLKSVEVPMIAKDVYKATLKLFLVLQHDYPEFLAVNFMALCAAVPVHCSQLLGVILLASPSSIAKVAVTAAAAAVSASVVAADGLPEPDSGNIGGGQGGPALGDDGVTAGLDVANGSCEDAAAIIAEHDLLGLVDAALAEETGGPSEDAVAHLARAFTRGGVAEDDGYTSFGHVPVPANSRLMGAVVVYVGCKAAHRVVAAARSSGLSSSPFDADAAYAGPEASLLSFLARELPTSTRYHFLAWFINCLRFPGPHTTFFSRLILDLFGHDLNDADDSDIRQQITRLLLERIVGFWKQPYGVAHTALELVKGEKYMFFDQPFIKASPEVVERFASLMAPGRP